LHLLDLHCLQLICSLASHSLLQIGDLYYDSGDPEIGLYAMDTQGNLYNFYNDIGGERKITPVSHTCKSCT
jgi:hypothetical protein